MCHERGDTWVDTVQARLLNVDDLRAANAVYHRGCNDLRAANAVYHRGCSVNLRTKKQIPAIHDHEMHIS